MLFETTSFRSMPRSNKVLMISWTPLPASRVGHWASRVCHFRAADFQAEPCIQGRCWCQGHSHDLPVELDCPKSDQMRHPRHADQCHAVGLVRQLGIMWAGSLPSVCLSPGDFAHWGVPHHYAPHHGQSQHWCSVQFVVPRVLWCSRPSASQLSWTIGDSFYPHRCQQNTLVVELFEED